MFKQTIVEVNDAVISVKEKNESENGNENEEK